MVVAEQTSRTKSGELRSLAELFKALADETRLFILVLLWDGEKCVCEIMTALPISQPAVSHHLKILRQAGLVKDERRGKWIFYHLNREALEAMGKFADCISSLKVQLGQEHLFDAYLHCKNGSDED